MRYRQLDEILELVPGQKIVATRTLRRDEDYLRDHFPLFPVMPGVMMLEALFQASMWLVHATEGFQHSVISLREARNVKFADFMEPGHLLTVTAEIVKMDETSATIKASGGRNEVVAVSGRLLLGKNCFGPEDPQMAALDVYMLDAMRTEFQKLRPAIRG